MAQVTGRLATQMKRMVVSKWRLQAINVNYWEGESKEELNSESTKRTSLTLLLRCGLIPLHESYTTNQPLQIEDGIHSNTIVCVTQKLLQHGTREDLLVVVAAMPIMMAGKMSWYLLKDCSLWNYSTCPKGYWDPWWMKCLRNELQWCQEWRWFRRESAQEVLNGKTNHRREEEKVFFWTSCGSAAMDDRSRCSQ